MKRNGHPRVKRCYTVVGHGPDRVELRSGVWNPTSFTVSDDSESGHLYRIVSRLDGSASPAELAREEGMRRSEVEAVVDHLTELDVLETAASSAFDVHLDALLPWPAQAEVEDRPVVVLGAVDLAERIADELRRSAPDLDVAVPEPGALERAVGDPAEWIRDGLGLERRLHEAREWRDSFLILAESTIDPPLETAINRLCLELEIPWLYAAIDGPFLFVGPLTVPGESACWECFERRVTMNLRERESYLRYKRALAEGRVLRSRVELVPLLGSVLAAHASLEALNFVLSGSTCTIGKVLSIYVPTMELAYNDVLRLPGCPGCGTLPERDEPELYFDMRALLSPSP
jgi:bacteriocin biosynthesis cyclodehydratase domain-containing protein